MLPILYKSLVRPLLEYGNLIWGPFYIQDQRLIENIQRRATRLVTTVRHYPYTDRLTLLNLPTLSYRRKRGDMISLYLIIQGHIYPDISNLSTFASYQRKLFKSRYSCHACSNFFSSHMVNDWNSLPDYVINAPTISTLKE